MQKMKIVWLCNYSLATVNHVLKLDTDFSEKHPVTWLYYLADELSKRESVELHIITLKNMIRKDYHFIDNNIHFHIMSEMPENIPELGLKIISKLGILKKHKFWKSKVIELVSKINPDIINTHGTEGELQTVSNEIFYPTLIWMQGLMNQVIKAQKNKKYDRWLKNENEIIQVQKNFISFPGEMEDIIRSKNSEANIYNLYHPLPKYAFDLYKENIEKNNDLIFVGELVKRKGIEDFIDTIYLLKEKRKNIKSKILGFSGNQEYCTSLLNKIEKLNLNDNIEFCGFIADHKDVLMEIKRSRIMLLPTYVDTGPRSIAESMTVGTPVISYNIDGIPEMITHNKSGILVQLGNVNELVQFAEELLNNPQKANEISYNAYNIARSKYLSKNVVDTLLKIYAEIEKRDNNNQRKCSNL